MTHAILNDNCTVSRLWYCLNLLLNTFLQMLHHYLLCGDSSSGGTTYVPVTFKHFQLLARLGKPPVSY